ncbi:ubiquitin-conjugating enzyme E2 T-like [Polistes fuscatus]|uniref:ubiquitin-conjugating enzyme E2 T-like n=1 Tax=Polistes fuscatus TaxID=30207 RepID=UPI001CA93931|nr:ubiquitin-conjugating enzyme E2 T-like [Polistes fuscatus]
MNQPPEGIFCFRKEGTDDGIIVTIVGPPGCSYEADVLELDLDLPPRYPFHPPHIQFRTPVYHPNIDNNGRICLDLLKMPPTGAWKPTLKLADVLVAIKLLLIHPNVDDPLMPEIADEYINNRLSFEIKARRLHDCKRKRSLAPSLF